MRANITTAPVFPGDAADGAAVVGMIRSAEQAFPGGGVSAMKYSLPKSAKARHNFWLYDPQHELDRAPRKSNKQ